MIFPRPRHEVALTDYTYEVLKRCERVFVEGKSPENYTLSDKVKQDYERILKENKANNETRDIPEQYRSRHNGESLQEGDLVYFNKHNNLVTQMKPVLVSRSVDDQSLVV